jgi:hypothetical protein
MSGARGAGYPLVPSRHLFLALVLPPGLWAPPDDGYAMVGLTVCVVYATRYLKMVLTWGISLQQAWEGVLRQ